MLHVSALLQLALQQRAQKLTHDSYQGRAKKTPNCTTVTARTDRQKTLFCYLNTLSYIAKIL